MPSKILNSREPAGVKQSEPRNLEFIPQSGRTNVKPQSVKYISLKQLRAKSLPSSEAKGLPLNAVKGRVLRFAPTSEPDTPKGGYHKLVEDAKRQLDDAEQRATAILWEGVSQASHAEEAKKQAERVKNEAFEKGYQEGFAQGEEAGKIKVKEESGPLVKFLKTAIEEVSSLKSSILKEMEPEIVKLSLQLAEKLVLNSFQIHPEAIVSIIKNLIKKVEDEEEIKILVNPSALPILEEYQQQFLDIIKSESKLKIEGDEKISQGGCLIVTDTKIVDAQIETRILEAVNLVSGEW